MEERGVTEAGDDGVANGPGGDDDVRRMQDGLCLTPAENARGPATRGGVVFWGRLELRRRPYNEILDEGIVLDPLGELVPRSELWPVGGIGFVQN